jgi:Fe-S cluster assembly ATP-binding protein
MLSLQHVSTNVDGKSVVNQVSLSVKPGEIHALMGPNGSGKSSLSLTLMGHPHYQLGKESQIILNNKSLVELSPDERAKAGLFLAFQYPVAIPGVTVLQTLKAALESTRKDQTKTTFSEVRKQAQIHATELGIDTSFLNRPINDGFSGGEKKRIEMISLLTLKPKYAVLDETDSGLDIDSIKLVAKAIQHAAKKDHVGILIITHYRRILDYVSPDKVSVMINGKIATTDGPKLVEQIEANGYKSFT